MLSNRNRRKSVLRQGSSFVVGIGVCSYTAHAFKRNSRIQAGSFNPAESSSTASLVNAAMYFLNAISRD
jgi:hypothetical protein